MRHNLQIQAKLDFVIKNNALIILIQTLSQQHPGKTDTCSTCIQYMLFSRTTWYIFLLCAKNYGIECSFIARQKTKKLNVYEFIFELKTTEI